MAYHIHQVYEELVQQILLPTLNEPHIHVVIEYSESNESTDFSVSYNGEPFDVTQKGDALSLSILKSASAEMNYSVDTDVRTRGYDWFHKGLGVFWHTLPIRIRTWTGFIPMLYGMAATPQAAQLRSVLMDPNIFLCSCGVRTLDRNERMYNLEATSNPSNWLGPVWMVSNYVAFRGLLNYGFDDDARQIAEKSLNLLARDIEKTGTLHEYYHPETGEPIVNADFLNWNMLALSMYRELEGDPPLLPFAELDQGDYPC